MRVRLVGCASDKFKLRVRGLLLAYAAGGSATGPGEAVSDHYVQTPAGARRAQPLAGVRLTVPAPQHFASSLTATRPQHTASQALAGTRPPSWRWCQGPPRCRCPLPAAAQPRSRALPSGCRRRARQAHSSWQDSGGAGLSRIRCAMAPNCCCRKALVRCTSRVACTAVVVAAGVLAEWGVGCSGVWDAVECGMQYGYCQGSLPC